MKQVEVAVIGTGWCGGIRAETLSRSALVDKLHICEIRPDRLAEVKALTRPATATLDYQDIIKNPNISVVYISTTPEQNHYPITRDCLKAGKHVLLEKPIAMELWEADELITLARRGRLKFTIGYSQRFNTKFAYAKKKITDGTLGKVVSVMVSRHLSRGLGAKIAKRVKLSPVVMESTHDLDFVFWLLEPAKPVRVYSQGAYGYMQPINGSYDVMWSIVTMDNGMLVTIGGGWNLPPGYPQFLLDLGRDHRHRGRPDPRRHPPRRLAQHRRGRNPLSDVDHAGRAGRSRVRGPDGPGNHPLPRGLHHGPASDGDARERPHGDGNLHRRRSLGRAQRADRPAAVERDALRGRRNGGSAAMSRRQAKSIGLAIIGAGRVGLFRGEVAARHPAVQWIGIAEKNHNRGLYVAEKIGADFVTQDYRELLKRPEVTCVIIATDEHLHVDPIMGSVERGVPMLIEKPLATDLGESARVLKAITDAKLDAVVGYTQRFRRKWLAAKEKVRTGALGDVTLVTSRAFMNRLVAIDNYKRTNDPKTISPMVISGTHALDIVMWYMEAKTPVECYARSIDKVLGPLYQGIDATAGMIMFSDGSVYHLNISWALPVTWPGAVYSLEVGITGTEGVLTIDDTHRDMVLAVSAPQEEGYAPDKSRLVDFMGSYPPGDMALGELRGPMREETDSWLNRIALDLPTQAATAAEAHNRLMLTKALDLSARRKQAVKLPLAPDEERAAA